MSWSVLQSFANTGVSPTTVAATPGSNLTSGSKLVAYVGTETYQASTTPNSVKDANNNSFTNVSATTGTGGSNAFKPAVSVWVLDTPAGDAGTKPAITVTYNPGVVAGAFILVQEVSGLLAGTSASVDGTPGTAGPANTAASMAQPAYTSGAASEFLVSIGAQPGNGFSVTQSAGYTLDTNSPQPSTTTCQGQVAYKNSTGGAESGTWTWSGGTTDTTAFIVLAFKLAGGGPTVAPFYPFRQAVRARLVPNAPKAGTVTAEFASATGSIAGPLNGAGFGSGAGANGAPVQNPTPGPVFRQAVQAVRARVPKTRLAGVYMGVAAQDTSYGTGQVQWNSGGPVRNPTQGPVFHQAVRPIRAPIPQTRPGGVFGSTGPSTGDTSFGSGRVMWSSGAPVQNPTPGPVFTQKPKPVQFRIPPWKPRAGRIGSSFGAPVANPIHGPPVYALLGPVRARLPQLQPRAGRVCTSLLPAAIPPVNTGPVFIQANQAIRARVPQASHYAGLVYGSLGPRSGDTSFGSGRVMWGAGGPVQNPAPGPALLSRPNQRRSRADLRLPVRGRVYTTAQPLTAVTPAPAGPPFYPAVQAVRARLPLQPFLRGRTSSNAGAPVRNPVQGPVFRQATAPARARTPLPPRGRTASNPGGPVQNPPPVVVGPAFYPRNFAKAQLPLPRRGVCRAIRFGSLPANPVQGPVFRQATTPIHARAPLPPRGRVASNPGGPVQNPPPIITGPPFFPFRSPARVHPVLPPRGRIASSPGAPLRNPAAGPVFRQATQPARARIPQVFSKGRVASSPGTAVYSGPVFRQATSPARIRPALPPRGRVTSNPGGPVSNPGPPAIGPVFRPATSPARIRPSLPPRGRITSGPGAPLRIPTSGPPVTPPHGPVQARFPLPPRGRTASNPGIPVIPPPVPAPVYPLHGPVMARRPLPPHGRCITGNPGAPVRNPHAGPVFRQLNWPARARIPQNAPRGRTASNPGGPVANIPFATLRFRTGTPCFQWATGTPQFQWATGTPEAG